MYDAGQGVEKDLAEAAKWFRAAAQQKVPQAEYAVGACYADGEGVPKDMIEAYKWISLAAAHGLSDAATFKGTLEKKLTPEEKAKAEQLVSASVAGGAKPN
jgi:TPR repeat protein